AQDDWKFNSRLTLNLGLRYEPLSTAHEKQNFLSNIRGFNDGSPAPVSIIHPADTPRVGTPGVSNCTLVHCYDLNNWAPRVGFASYPSRDFHNPYAQQWNLTVQRELPYRFVAEIGYVGTRGVGLIGTGRAVNQSQICTLAGPCLVPASLASGVSIAPGANGVVR